MANGGNRARTALMNNLPKKGWEVDGDVGTFEDLTIKFGDEEWTMTQKKDKKTIDVASGAYGKTQMNEVKKAAASAGSAFAPTGKGGGQGRKPLSEEQKQKMREKRQAKAAEKKAEKESADKKEDD